MAEEEEEATTAAASAKDPVTAASMPSSTPPPSPCWAVGARLESKARDTNGGEQWFPAKLLEVEADRVLVHYMQWNARHDEWIPSNSSRLRPASSQPNSGKSSRHSSGGGNDFEPRPVTPILPPPPNKPTPAAVTGLPAHKDFKPGDKVMATWKLNRKYLATVIKYEGGVNGAAGGTYLVEFYDGVQCHVKPNNMRRPKKGEEDVDQQEALRVNGAADNGSAENSDCEEAVGSSGGRRERKRKFDVKTVLGVRSVKSLRSNSKEDNVSAADSSEATVTTTSLATAAPTAPTTAATPVSSAGSVASSALSDKKSRNSKEKRKRRPERKISASAAAEQQQAPAQINGKARSESISDGPALAAVSGKRERRKKKFWDEEEDTVVSTTLVTSTVSTSSSSSAAVKSSKELPPSSGQANMVSSALKRKSSISSHVTNPIPKKTVKKLATATEKATAQIEQVHTASHNKPGVDNISDPTAATVRPNGVEPVDHHSVHREQESERLPAPKPDKPSGKENGKVLPYLQLDLGADPELIAEKMIEGVNIPGMGQPIPVDSSSLPEGWEKRVIQRRIGITKGKWDVFITNPETGKSFRSKTELQKHLDERKLPYTSDAFDFSLDDNLKRLRQIWKQYKVKPFLNNPKGTGVSTNFKHVPAKITQVQDSDVASRGGGGGGGGGGHHHLTLSPSTGNNGSVGSVDCVSNKALPVAAATVTAPPPPAAAAANAAPSTTAAAVTSLLSVPSAAAPAGSLTGGTTDADCLSEFAKESETGQGLRCSIARCGKLFRNDRLLRQHVKHYHPKVYGGLLCKHPQIGDDISEPTSPEATRRLSDSSEFYHDSYATVAAAAAESRRRMPSSESSCYMVDKQPQQPRRSAKKSLLDEEAPLSSIYHHHHPQQEMPPEDSADTFIRRTRNDSVLSSVPSDTEDLLIVGDPHFQQHQLQLYHHQQQQLQQQQQSLPPAVPPHQAYRSNCPPTPPTFRLSKRRQAQMRKRVQQPVIRVSKIEDTPLGREYRDELLSMATGTGGPYANGLVTSSNTTSPTSVNILDSGTGLTPSSYPPSEMDASIAGSEHLTNEELVNCTCRRIEEDGLMIQCDICLCWQHGYCAGIEDEDPVPEKHVCETCRQPAGGRTEAKFSLDQDWLKEGKLPSTDTVIDLHQTVTKRKSASAIFDRETAFRKLSELMADLATLDKVLHCLRVKLHVASQPSNSKVFMWSSVWSVATHQPMSMDDEEEEEAEETEAGLEDHEDDDEDDMDSSSMQRCKEMHDQAAAAINRQSAIDPHAVAEKLNLLASANKNQQEAADAAAASADYKIAPDSPAASPPTEAQQQLPKVNGISRDQQSSANSDAGKKMEPTVAADDDNTVMPTKERQDSHHEVPSANDQHTFRGSNTTNTAADLTSQKDEPGVPVAVAKATTKASSSTTSSSGSSPPPPLPLPSSSSSGSTPAAMMAMAMQGLQQTRGTATANHVNAHECETKSKTEEEALTNGNLAADEHYSSPPAAAESMEMADTSNGSKDFIAAKDIANSVVEKKSNNPNQGTPLVAGVAHLHHHHPVVASTPAAAADHFDTSFIPSVSDIERLLPSVIQEIESVKNALQSPTSAASVITASNAVVATSSSSSHNNSTSSVMVGGPSSAGTPGGHPAGASSSSPRRFASHHHHNSGFIPEPKRLDRDECRLNLLQHIESVQAEVEYRYSAIESAISKIEAMPGASNAGFSLEQISVGDAKMKAKLNKLIQDLSVARQLTWTL